ncbi:MAG: DUF4202 domain-containing protein [Cyclobacteriaceae bacterium]
MSKLQSALDAIDAINQQDPNIERDNGQAVPKEILYSRRMTEMLLKYEESPTEELQIAARGQHIKRWDIPRKDFPMDRNGYLKWRTNLKLMHGRLLSEIMDQAGYDQSSIDTVSTLVTKKKLKTDAASKKLEDVVCLVFLQYYFADFSKEQQEDKIIDIVQKTWEKMTEKGHEMALQLPLGETELELVKKALG